MFPLTTVKFCKSEASVEALLLEAELLEAEQFEAGQFVVAPPIVEERSFDGEQL